MSAPGLNQLHQAPDGAEPLVDGGGAAATAGEGIDSQGASGAADKSHASPPRANAALEAKSSTTPIQQQQQQQQAAKAAPKLPPAALAPSNVNLSQGVVRALSDRSYEKRKAGAIEIEKVIREKTNNGQGGGEEYVVTLIHILTMDYACSINSNQRKGGLIGLAAVALGLGSTGTPKFLQYLLPPVLKCFDDPEVRVRYYACEALYNIAKVARKHILAYFNALFDGLCKLFADVDVDVKNGAQLLDRLVKEVVTENCDTFQVSMFIPLLEKYLKMTNPYIRQFLVGWILALDAVPDIDMLEHLPKFLDGIFNMLSDGNREIRQQSDMALARFLAEIREDPAGTFEERHLVAVIAILISQSSSAQRFNRLTAVTWILEFIDMFKERLVVMYSGILGVLLNSLSDSEQEIQSVADKAHDKLLELVRGSDTQFALRPLIAVVTLKLAVPPSARPAQGNAADALVVSPAPLPTRMAALRWISLLLDKFPDEMEEQIDRLTPAMLAALADPSDDLVVLDLAVLGRIARNTSRMDEVIGQVVSVFRKDRTLFDNRGTFVVRKLCVLLEPGLVYLILAREIDKEADLDFAHLMVQALNLILLTAPELTSFRASLKRSWRVCCGLEGDVEEDNEGVDADGDKNGDPQDPVFVTLFKTWCFDPVATLSLCLLSQCYDLSTALVIKLADVNLSVGFLMEVDKLVQLVESPAFLSLRLELVNTGSAFRPALLQTLYGLLMILPQSGAYTTLANRLSAASSLHLALASSGGGSQPAPAGLPGAGQEAGAAAVSRTKKIFKFMDKGVAAAPAAAAAAAAPPGNADRVTSRLTDPAVQERKVSVEARLLEHFLAVQSRIVETFEQSIQSKSLLAKDKASKPAL